MSRFVFGGYYCQAQLACGFPAWGLTVLYKCTFTLTLLWCMIIVLIPGRIIDSAFLIILTNLLYIWLFQVVTWVIDYVLVDLQMRVSFSLNGTAHVHSSKPSTFRSDIIEFFLTSVGATLTEITDVELRLVKFLVMIITNSWLISSHKYMLGTPEFDFCVTIQKGKQMLVCPVGCLTNLDIGIFSHPVWARSSKLFKMIPVSIISSSCCVWSV